MTNKTLTQFFNEAKKAESLALANASKAALDTSAVLLAMVIKQSRIDCESGFMAKKAVNDFLFKLYKIEKTDSQKSTIYNKSAVVCYILKNHQNECLHLRESLNYTDEALMQAVKRITCKYKDQASILQAILKGRKPKDDSKKNRQAVTIDDKNFSREDIRSVINGKIATYNQTDSELQEIIVMMANLVKSTKTLDKIESAVKARVDAIKAQAKKAKKAKKAPAPKTESQIAA